MLLNKVGELKHYRRFGLSSLVYIFLTSSLLAGSFEDFKSVESSAFKKYRDKDDIKFTTYLKEKWQEYTAKESPALYEKQKPKHITPARERKIKDLGPRVNIKIPKVKEEIKTDKKPILVEKKNKDIYINYFGQELGFSIDETIRDAQFYPQNQTGIAKFFDRMALSEYEQTLSEIEEVQENLKLNDWGLYQLVEQLSKAIYSSPDSQKLFSWFLFNKLGYEVKIGLGAKHVLLMHYSKKIIYATPHYTFGDKKFYVISSYSKSIHEKIYTYKQNYPNANRALDLGLYELPNFKKNLEYKTLSFKQF
ncbi:MAG: hypothetical protein Q9M34_02535, partial [Sulfurimonas sp.]|nr:hypothetical protein [Sulfurimonas sp.]